MIEDQRKTLLARVASTICGAACGLYSECKSREAAQALFDAGYLSTLKPEGEQISGEAVEQTIDRLNGEIVQMGSYIEKLEALVPHSEFNVAKFAAMSTAAEAKEAGIREAIAIVERPANVSNSMEWKYDYVLPALRALLTEGKAK